MPMPRFNAFRRLFSGSRENTSDVENMDSHAGMRPAPQTGDAEISGGEVWKRLGKIALHAIGGGAWFVGWVTGAVIRFEKNGGGDPDGDAAEGSYVSKEALIGLGAGAVVTLNYCAILAALSARQKYLKRQETRAEERDDAPYRGGLLEKEEKSSSDDEHQVELEERVEVGDGKKEKGEGATGAKEQLAQAMEEGLTTLPLSSSSLTL